VPDVPRLFPAASLTGLDGRAHALPPERARHPAVILFGHSDCGTTRLALPFVDRMAARAGEGRVLAVLQDDENAARALAEELRLRLPVLLEREPYALADALALTTVPTLFLVEPDGGIAVRSEGFRRDALEAVAARLDAQPLFESSDTVPLLRPG
jgi:hypothetical protein